jgi:acetyl esterase/lipase
MASKMPSQIPTIGLDPELERFLAQLPIVGLNAETLPVLRGLAALKVEDLPLGDKIAHAEYTIPGPGGDITASVFTPTNPSSSEPMPCLYWIHGGGMVQGNRLSFLGDALDLVIENNAVFVTVDYRLAPEHPDPAPIEDCYAGLVWTRDHASQLGIDTGKIMVIGGSAGGGLAAGLALLCRDRKGPKLCAQCLVYPMIDDKNDTLSCRQFKNAAIWTASDNDFGWTSLLGDRKGGNDVSIYAAPARAQDLSGLPPAFIDVASTEIFRDEDVAYAQKLWASGVECELHVWPGGFHGFDVFAPKSQLSQVAISTRAAWIKRTFASLPPTKIAGKI